MTAPFIAVGRRPVASRIHAIMPVTVDLPLVPATPIGSGLALNRSASRSARRIRRHPVACAATMSATLSSTAAEATTIWSAETIPLPSCANRSMPSARNAANLAGTRPWSSPRSDPATTAPRPRRIMASGIIPDPPIPTRK